MEKHIIMMVAAFAISAVLKLLYDGIEHYLKVRSLLKKLEGIPYYVKLLRDLNRIKREYKKEILTKGHSKKSEKLRIKMYALDCRIKHIDEQTGTYHRPGGNYTSPFNKIMNAIRDGENKEI